MYYYIIFYNKNFFTLDEKFPSAYIQNLINISFYGSNTNSLYYAMID